MSDRFLATGVGSLPKPGWLQAHGAMNAGEKDHHGKGADWRLEGEALRGAQDDAVRLAIHDQERAGLDIVSDGEQRRRSYMTYVTMRLGGFDYETLGEKWIRNGRRLAHVGRCVGPVTRPAPILRDDLAFVLGETDHPVKVTLPGPMTVVDSTLDVYYEDEKALALAVADALNVEARDLDALGPAVIQFDEPVFSRYPDKVADWGVEALDRACAGLAARTCAHVCYSYPMPGVPRPITDSYPVILEALEHSQVDQLALEFEAPRLDPALLRRCPSKTVLFGCIDNGSDEVESPEHVAARLLAAAEHLPPEQIQAAPDCGLVPLTAPVARAKLKAMVDGARLARERGG
jgi:5-methyltetrahydropteroyltriglutamate--homocysteine methyltransferase